MTANEKTILIADDDVGITMVLEHSLTKAGYHVMATGNAETLLSWVIAGTGDAVITDINMPGRSGLDILPEMKQARPELPVLIISAQKTYHLADVKAYQYLDFMAKPFDLEAVKKHLQESFQKTQELNTKPASITQFGMIGQSSQMQQLYQVITRLKESNLTILIKGETGTGKEVVAKALHENSKWSSGPFVAMNMAAIPHELLEAELFGHEKGAFTGAHQKRIGRFAEAEGGTLFLDEIGDMPYEAQTRLLRVLQEGEYTPIGSNQTFKTKLRIVTATHQDLEKQVAVGKFRQDLYYRLNIVPIYLPPLRERLSDLPEFIDYFVAKSGCGDVAFTKGAITWMQQQYWAGNIRELENFIYRVLALHGDVTHIDEMMLANLSQPSGQVLQQALPMQETQQQSISEMIHMQLQQYFDAYEGGTPPDGLYDRVIEQVEKPMISLCLKATNGNQIQAAKLLGLNRNTLRKKIKMLQIPIIKE